MTSTGSEFSQESENGSQDISTQKTSIENGDGFPTNPISSKPDEQTNDTTNGIKDPVPPSAKASFMGIRDYITVFFIKNGVKLNSRNFIKLFQYFPFLSFVALFFLLIIVVPIIVSGNGSLKIQSNQNTAISVNIKSTEISNVFTNGIFYQLKSSEEIISFFRLLSKGRSTLHCYLPEILDKIRGGVSNLPDKSTCAKDENGKIDNQGRVSYIQWETIEISTRLFIVNKMLKAYYLHQTLRKQNSGLLSPIYNIITFNSLPWPDSFVVIDKNSAEKHFTFAMEGTAIENSSDQSNGDKFKEFKKIIRQQNKISNQYLPLWVHNKITEYSNNKAIKEYDLIDIDNLAFNSLDNDHQISLVKITPYIPLIVLPMSFIYKELQENSPIYSKNEYYHYMLDNAIVFFMMHKPICEEFSPQNDRHTEIPFTECFKGVTDFMDCVYMEKINQKKKSEPSEGNIPKSHSESNLHMSFPWLEKFTGPVFTCILPKNFWKIKCHFSAEKVSLLKTSNSPQESITLSGEELFILLATIPRKTEQLK